MLIIVVAFSAILISVGFYGIAQPAGLAPAARQFIVWPGIWTGFVLRFIFAFALWAGAPNSHTPGAFKVLAVLTGLVALSLPVLGSTELTHLLEWWLRQSREVRQLWAGASLATGSFVLWSAIRGVRRP
jgi:hypothetical protein